MGLKMILYELEKRPGNFYNNPNDIYISLYNMLSIQDLLKNCGEMPSLLITPYLIDKNNHRIFELHYYEFEIKVCDLKKSYLVDYPKGNLLSGEIINNFKPKAFVALNDFEFYKRILNNYLDNIQKASFRCEFSADNELKEFELYFQIF